MLIPRLAILCLALLGLALQTGCKQEEPAEPAPAINDTPSEPSPQPGSDPQPEPDLEPEPEPAAEVDPDAPNAKHPIAKRSAFPEPGETLNKPIPAEQLSDLNPFAQAIDPDDIPAIVPWDQAKKYVGYEITVEGKIVNVGQSRDGKVNFLNFHQDWRGKFYMVIFDDLAKTLDKSVSDTFTGRTVRVKGVVEPHRGRPQIRILSMDQVRFIDE